MARRPVAAQAGGIALVRCVSTGINSGSRVSKFLSLSKFLSFYPSSYPLLCGYSLSYSPEPVGFFMFPADPNHNNLRVYVMTYSTVEIRAGAGAEAMARKAIEAEAA